MIVLILWIISKVGLISLFVPVGITIILIIIGIIEIVYEINLFLMPGRIRRVLKELEKQIQQNEIIIEGLLAINKSINRNNKIDS
jgi:hypothetical protein